MGDYLDDKELAHRLEGKKVKRVHYDAKAETLTIEVTGGVGVTIEAVDYDDGGDAAAELRFRENVPAPRPLRKGDVLTQNMMHQGKPRTAYYLVTSVGPDGPALLFKGWATP